MLNWRTRFELQGRHHKIAWDGGKKYKTHDTTTEYSDGKDEHRRKNRQREITTIHGFVQKWRISLFYETLYSFSEIIAQALEPVSLFGRIGGHFHIDQMRRQNEFWFYQRESQADNDD